MSLRMVTEEKVESYRNLIMEGDATCVGFGSSCLGESGRLCRRCEQASTAGCGNENKVLFAVRWPAEVQC